MTALRDRIVEALESIVDATSLAATLDGLEALAHMKASHVESTWGDAGLARAWSRVATKISTARVAAEREGV